MLPAPTTWLAPADLALPLRRDRSPVRILHLLKHAQPSNGNVLLAVDLACAQADRGHDVVVAAARNDFVDVLSARGVAVVDVPEPTGPRSAMTYALRVLGQARRSRPDVVHAHMMAPAMVGAALRAVMGIPLVTTVHNSFDKHSSLMRVGSAVVAVSEAERQGLLARGFPAARLHTVKNAVGGSARLSAETDHIGNLHQPSIITLCGLHQRKGVDDVISAFEALARDFPEWHLSLVGAGPDRSRLEERVQSAGLEQRVHFMGTTRTPQYLLGQAAIYVSAALAEPFSLSTAEARLAGCAVVATAVGGVPEVVAQGRAGLLVPPSDPRALAAALRGLMADPAALAEWRRRSAEDTDWLGVSRMAADYETVYQRVCSRGERRPTSPPLDHQRIARTGY